MRSSLGNISQSVNVAHCGVQVVVPAKSSPAAVLFDLGNGGGMASQRDDNHPAQGCEARATLGQDANRFINPEGVESIPHIPFVKLDFAFFK